MITYTIKQVSEMTGLSIPTLRYYDKEGLFPEITRKVSNYRVFTDVELDLINLIECFKKAGLEIKEIKHYMQLIRQGDSSLQERLEIMYRQKAALEQKKKELDESIATVEWKISFYQRAISDGTEKYVLEEYLKGKGCE